MKYKFLLTILISIVIVFGFMSYVKASEYESPVSLYHDNYFISGFNLDTQVKFQVSVKYSLIFPSTTGVFLGYTQLSKWDLYSKSSPFKETNYMPEAFFKFETKTNFLEKDLGYIDYIQVAPIAHRSNGRDGVDSRSENKFYGQIQLSKGEVYNFGINCKVFGYYNVDKKRNKDINDYHHNYECDLFFKIKSKTVEELDKEEVHLRFGGNPLNKGFFESTVKFRIVSSVIQVRAYAQFFRGYDEFFIDYNIRDTAARIGFCF